ncbi:MAG: hypothetical protein WEB07_01240 [Natronospirillum sp.]
MNNPSNFVTASTVDYQALYLPIAEPQVDVPADGPQALSVLQQTPEVDLTLTDVIMPDGLSGQELVAETHRIQSALSILFTFGYTENAILQIGHIDHNVQLLKKRYRQAGLARKVRAVFDQKTTLFKSRELYASPSPVGFRR